MALGAGARGGRLAHRSGPLEGVAASAAAVLISRHEHSLAAVAPAWPARAWSGPRAGGGPPPAHSFDGPPPQRQPFRRQPVRRSLCLWLACGALFETPPSLVARRKLLAPQSRRRRAPPARCASGSPAGRSLRHRLPSSLVASSSLLNPGGAAPLRLAVPRVGGRGAGPWLPFWLGDTRPAVTGVPGCA